MQKRGITESILADQFPHIKPIYKAKDVKMLDFGMVKNWSWLVVTSNLVMTQFAYSACLIHLTPRIQAVIQPPICNSTLTSDGQPEAQPQQFSKSTLMMIVGICEILSQLSAASMQIYLKNVYKFNVATLY